MADAAVVVATAAAARAVELYPPPECDDGVHNGYETDVDCGSSVAVGALEFDSKRTSSDPTAKVKVDVDERVQLAGRTFTIALWVKFQDDFMGGRQVLVSDKSLDGGLEWCVPARRRLARAGARIKRLTQVLLLTRAAQVGAEPGAVHRRAHPRQQRQRARLALHRRLVG